MSLSCEKAGMPGGMPEVKVACDLTTTEHVQGCERQARLKLAVDVNNRVREIIGTFKPTEVVGHNKGPTPLFVEVCTPQLRSDKALEIAIQIMQKGSIDDTPLAVATTFCMQGEISPLEMDILARLYCCLFVVKQ